MNRKRAAAYAREGDGAAADWFQHGTMVVLRPTPEMGRLLRGARAGEFEIVIVHSLDRLADERVPLEAILRALVATGVEVRSVVEEAVFTACEATIRNPVYRAVHAELLDDWNNGVAVAWTLNKSWR